MSSSARPGLGVCLAVGALVLAGAPARPQGKGDGGEIRGIKLGLKAQSMTTDGFDEFACGSNGGPPRQKLEGWSGVAQCGAEPRGVCAGQAGLHGGLRKVQVRFDDELEYVGKAIADERYTDQQGSTRVAGHPVILSVLFDE